MDSQRLFRSLYDECTDFSRPMRSLAAAVVAGWTIALAAPALGFQDARAEHPLAFDRTGVEWALDFSEARDRARASNRLLMIKPVAFGTTPDGGW